MSVRFCSRQILPLKPFYGGRDIPNVENKHGGLSPLFGYILLKVRTFSNCLTPRFYCVLHLNIQVLEMAT